MKHLLLTILLLFPVGLFAQDDDLPNAFVAGGAAYNESASPNVLGWGTFAKRIAGPVFSFTTYDITPIMKDSGLPTLQYAARTGIAVRMYQFGESLSVFGLGDAGISTTGQAVNGSFSGGGFGAIRLGKGWHTLLILRIIHDPVVGTRYIPEAGVGLEIK